MYFSNEEWREIYPLLPKYPRSSKGGRPRLNQKLILEGILYVFEHKIPWKSAPKLFGSGTSLNDYFREWAKDGVFHRLKNHNFLFTLNLDWEKINSLKDSVKQTNTQINGDPLIYE